MTSPVLLALRAATEDLHRDVESLAERGGVLRSRAGLLVHLRVLFMHHRALSVRLSEHVGARDRVDARVSELAHDLDVLGETVSSLDAFDAEPAAGLRYRWNAQALGACYVVEGSRLGGLTIARALAIGGEVDPSRLSSFASKAPEVSRRWRDFLGELAMLSPSGIDAAVDGAVDTFQDLVRRYQAVVGAPATDGMASPVHALTPRDRLRDG